DRRSRSSRKGWSVEETEEACARLVALASSARRLRRRTIRSLSIRPSDDAWAVKRSRFQPWNESSIDDGNPGQSHKIHYFPNKSQRLRRQRKPERLNLSKHSEHHDRPESCICISAVRHGNRDAHHPDSTHHSHRNLYNNNRGN